MRCLLDITSYIEKWNEMNENERIFFILFFCDPNKKLRVGADSGDTVGRPETDPFLFGLIYDFTLVIQGK